MQKNVVLVLVILGLTTLNLCHAQAKEEIEIPVIADLGLGFGELISDIDLTESDQRIFLFRPEISGSVSSETLIKYKDKIPEDIPKWLTKAGIAYSPYLLPTLYFTSSNESGESVYGASIGPGVVMNFGGEYFTLGGGVGLMASYFYIESDNFKDNNYLTLGANANWNIKIKPMKYFHLEVGQKYMQHIERELSNGKQIGQFREDYAMLHFRFPFTTNVKL